METSPTSMDVGRSRGSVPSTSGINLQNRVVVAWRRDTANIDRTLRDAPPEKCNEWTFRLPQEIVEMIVTHLACDLDALKTCSLTCRSWYIAAVPRLHRTLILRGKRPDETHNKLKPLSELHRLDLIPLVEEIQVRDGPSWFVPSWFVPQAFSPRDLNHFSAFANVQTLSLHRMEIHRFIPGIERYFGHFSPTLRSIALYAPYCTPRQLSCFLSLFANLDNTKILSPRELNAAIPDTELVPFSTPKFRGELSLHNFDWTKTWEDLNTSCGGLRFRYMDMCCARGCAPILLEACVETLETLGLNEPCDYFRPPPSLLRFDLSRLKVLRSLQVAATYLAKCHTAVVEAFSTITSPVFSELVVTLVEFWISNVPLHDTLFEILRTMNEVRPFKLVFLAQIAYLPQESWEEVRRKLAEDLDSATSKGLLDFLDSPPTIRTTSYPIPGWV